MIVMADDQQILVFEQHHHALASGVMAKMWNGTFPNEALRQHVEYAIAYHDRGWIPLDQTPIWNAEQQQPYSFMDYPMKEKLQRYDEGITDVERQSLYAGYLCSLHFCSFFPKESKDKNIAAFLYRENERQRLLWDKLYGSITEEEVEVHFPLLQFCDDLSLYCCMNVPGVSKEEELSWFRGGFRQVFPSFPNGMIARWDNEQTVSVDPFPFRAPFRIDFPYKRVSRRLINTNGWERAFELGEYSRRLVSFVPSCSSTFN
ncbi:DUF3891 family protein [Pontibacillus litoralis]|uniref:Uncharacterized protein n=1 Tax=Pontibacillus litoralis JSM 072002 TaxID=1385512 RepID=A0A0A5G0T7_9BACI|nr:DUF3891 family protein [Pontibacillus litoralis]KGX85654.1 hypothetical protein N784_08295 [Pontibacillus litoralis JSM 072002]